MGEPAPWPLAEPAIVAITGVQAAGKSTIAQALAERVTPSVHLRGDAFRRMIVNGQARLSEPLTGTARAQLRMRYDLAASAALGYYQAGFTVVLQDVVLGADWPYLLERLAGPPLLAVVLAPGTDAITQRERGRAKTAYAPGGFGVASLERHLREETPRIGLWLDTSAQSPQETVQEILVRAASWTPPGGG